MEQINRAKDFLEKLLTSYEASTYFRTGLLAKRIFINDKFKPFKEVFVNPTAVTYKQETLKELRQLENRHILKLNSVPYHEEQLAEIELVVENVDLLYKHLNKENPRHFLDEILTYLDTINSGIKGIDEFVKNEISYIKENGKIHTNKYKNLDELKHLISGLEHIYAIEDETMLRKFSSNVYGDSKTFENTYLSRICSVIKEFDDKNDYANMSNDEILACFNIVKNTTYALIKNCLNFKLNKQIIRLDDLGFEYSLDDKMIKELEILPSTIKKVVTIENLTSFQDYPDKDALVIFLSGFHNHTKQMLLKRIYKAYPNAEYYHYGDIDVGGFRIFVHLVNDTGIPFKPLHMFYQDLMDSKVTKPLQGDDENRLKAIVNDPRFSIFKKTIEYMLVHKIKLEQEALD